MKIAILGNMNNNGFSLLRYLLDLNQDADLLLFKDDEIGHSAHFSIMNDTWNYQKWSKHIISLNAVNSYGQALSGSIPCKVLLYIAYWLRRIMQSQNAIFTKPSSNKEIKDLKQVLKQYDLLIGSGATPAILKSMNLRLDIFFAYSIGIEYFEEEYFSLYRRSKNPLVRFISKQMVDLQIKGIKETKVCLNTEFTATKEAFDKIRVKTEPLNLPIVYPFEEANEEMYSNETRNIIEEIDSTEDGFILVSHARHQWIKPKNIEQSTWKLLSKNNDFILIAYADFLKLRPEADSFLILFEYGEDSMSSKNLCSELGLADRVRWLPNTPRKEILKIIEKCSVGLGEFYLQDVMWGGTGWEVLSKGKPLIQGFKKSKKQFIDSYGYPPPSIFSAESPEDITNHLISLFDDKVFLKETGTANFEWFKKYNAHNSGERILELKKLNTIQDK